PPANQKINLCRRDEPVDTTERSFLWHRHAVLEVLENQVRIGKGKPAPRLLDRGESKQPIVVGVDGVEQDPHWTSSPLDLRKHRHRYLYSPLAHVIVAECQSRSCAGASSAGERRRVHRPAGCVPPINAGDLPILCEGQSSVERELAFEKS